MSKVPMTVDGLRNLLTVAIANGTQNNWIAIAMSWAEQADKEINRLRKELTNGNTSGGSQASE